MALRDRLRPYGPAAASVVLLALAFPPFNLGLLVFVALVPWLLSLRELDAKQAVKSGYVFGLLFWLHQMQFVQPLVAKWTGNVLLSLIPWFSACLLGATYFAFLGFVLHRCLKSKREWLIPVAWAGLEVIRSFVPILAFPWGLISTPLYRYPPLIQLANYGTQYLVSAWVVAASVTVVLLFSGTGWNQLRYHALVFLGLLGLSIARYTAPEVGEPVTVTIGQPGVDAAFSDPEEEARKVGVAVAELSDSALAQRARLLILPEGMAMGGSEVPPDVPFDLTPGLPILFGGSRGPQPSYQSAFAFDGEWKFADKRRLVVFGEYVPLRGTLPFLDAFELPTGDLRPSDRTSAIQVAGMTVGPMLCFEGLFYDVAADQAKNGAQLLTVMSIDDWYVGTGAPEQLMSASVWRAVETGLPVARSASLGHSIAVDARGNIVARAPFGVTYPLRANLILPKQAERFPGIEVVPIALAIFLFGAATMPLPRTKTETPDRV